MLSDPHNQLYYPFQNQANDYSGHARHGTVNGSGVYATRPNGARCLYFDGTGDYVTTPSFGLSGTVLVFAADVRCKYNASIIQVILGQHIYQDGVGNIALWRQAATNTLNWEYVYNLTQGTAEAAAPNYFLTPYDDAWLHLMVVCDYAGKNVYFYRNGVPFGSPVAMTGTPIFPSTDRTKYIGGYITTQYPLTAGYLANVYLGTLPSYPSVAELTDNANRLMLGLHPIWSV